MEISSQQHTSFLGELDIESSVIVPVISYPHFSPGAYAERIDEMKSLGVTSIMIGNGKNMVNGLSIAGKGCVGLVVKAKIGRRIYALKIRREDSDRKSMEAEARLLMMANAAGVGPRLEAHTKNLIAMEFVEGQSISHWIRSASRRGVSRVTRSVLDQCYSLDRADLDHGQLSRLDRHVIVSPDAGGFPCIIDFETASTGRKPGNVTAAAQSLLLYGAIAGHVNRILGEVDRDNVILGLRKYKARKTKTNFCELLEKLPI
ncbi:MAG: serine/threonine protein kinase [Nitrososphaera sp.]